MRTTIIGALFALAALALAAGCGNSSGNTSTPTTGPTPTATPTYVPTGPPSTSAPVGTASPSSVSVGNGGFSVLVNFAQATSGSGTMAASGSTTVPASPAGIPAYVPASGTTLFYVVLQPSATITLPNYPQFVMTAPVSIVPQNFNYFGAVFTNDASFPHGNGAWYAQFLGAAANSGQNFTYPTPNPSTPLTFTANDYYVFALYQQPS